MPTMEGLPTTSGEKSVPAKVKHSPFVELMPISKMESPSAKFESCKSMHEQCWYMQASGGPMQSMLTFGCMHYEWQMTPLITCQIWDEKAFRWNASLGLKLPRTLIIGITLVVLYMYWMTSFSQDRRLISGVNEQGLVFTLGIHHNMREPWHSYFCFQLVWSVHSFMSEPTHDFKHSAMHSTTGIQSCNDRTSVTSHKSMHKPSNKCKMKTCPCQSEHRFCPMSCREQPMTVQVKMKHKTQWVDCYHSIQLLLHSKTPSCQHKTVKSKRHHKTWQDFINLRDNNAQCNITLRKPWWQNSQSNKGHMILHSRF